MRTAPNRGYLSLANPLAQGLSSAVTFDEGTGIDLYDRVTKQIWRLAGLGTSQWDGSAAGTGHSFNTVTRHFAYQSDPEHFLAAADVSIVIVVKKLDTTLRAASHFGNTNGLPTRLCQAHIPFSDGTIYWDFGGTGAGNRLSVTSTGLDLRQDNVWTFTAGAHGAEIWFNGHRIANSATARTRTVAAGLTYAINNGPAGNGDLAVYSGFYVWQRVLQESEIKRLAIDPYAPFRPVEQLVTQAAAVTVDTEAARVGLRAADTSLDLGATTIDTEAARLRIRPAVTAVDAGGVTVNTEASRLRLRSATTSITLGQVVVETTAGHIRLRSAESSIEVGAATVDTLAARLRTRAGITEVFSGARFIPEITCATLTLGAVCGVTPLPVESAILTLGVECEQ